MLAIRLSVRRAAIPGQNLGAKTARFVFVIQPLFLSFAQANDSGGCSKNSAASFPPKEAEFALFLFSSILPPCLAKLTLF